MEQRDLQILGEKMSVLKAGTRCIIIAGCPENIGLVVEVISHIGKSQGYEDGYYVATVSSRPFRQVWGHSTSDSHPVSTKLSVVSTERWKLRPLVDAGDDLSDTVESLTTELVTANV